ncbi:MAG: hypothetical protein Q7W13_17685 [Bacteroidia bacterium]|nr:hypothetical protein [Bacteroidia bacterium]
MNFLIKNKNFYFSIIFFITLLFSALRIISSFPSTNYGDELTYYGQAKNILEHGPSGFQMNAIFFLKDPLSHLYPPPIRIAHTFFSAVALKFSDTFRALSFLSLSFFITHCIVCFFFIKKYWGETASLIGGLLICLSPLSCGLAGRALSESGFYLFFTLSIFSLIDYLYKPGLFKVVLFILFFSICLLIKESAVFILPFFSLILLVEKFYLKKDLNIIHIFMLMLSPLLLIFCIYLLALGDLNNVMDIFNVMREINLSVPHTYILWYNSGPWYQYFVDYFILSPFTSLLFLFFVGHYFTNQKNHMQQITFLILFFVYFMIVFSFLPKNVRYAQPLDLIYRISSALMVIQLFKKSNLSIGIKRTIVISFFTLILMNDFWSYRNFFVVHNIYDPMSYNLLISAGFFGG